MMRNLTPLPFQSGAALIVALVLLAAITVVGMSNMQSSSMEMKMVASAKSRNEAFNLAEGALLAVERRIEAGMGIDSDELATDTCTDRCFTATCSDGRCFDGDYVSTNSRYECEISPNAGTTERVQFWRDDSLDVWNNSARHQTVRIKGKDVKFIFEFLCFIDNGNGFGPASPNNMFGDPIFRITALVDEDVINTGLSASAMVNLSSPVMLQSIYRIDDI